MDHDSQVPAGIPLRTLRRDLGAYGELQDSFARITQGVERDMQRVTQRMNKNLRLTTHSALTRPVLDTQLRIADSLAIGFTVHSLEALGASVRSAFKAQLRIANSMDMSFTLPSPDIGFTICSREMLDATRISLFDPAKDWNRSFGVPSAAYRQALEGALQMPTVDLQGLIGPPSRRTRRHEIVQVGMAVPDAAEHLAEDLIARHEVATDPFLYECINEVRHWLRAGRPISAVDRSHAAVHRMLQIIALEAGWEFNRRAGVLDLYRYVRKHHPVFVAGSGDGKALELFGSLAPILHKINEARNQHSLSHPSRGLLSESSARFFIHVTLAMFEFMADRERETQDDA